MAHNARVNAAERNLSALRLARLRLSGSDDGGVARVVGSGGDTCGAEGLD
jgi:hypothetical protein